MASEVMVLRRQEGHCALRLLKNCTVKDMQSDEKVPHVKVRGSSCAVCVMEAPRDETRG